MATCSMPTSTNDLVGDVVCQVLGALEPEFSIGSLNMYSFHSVILPSNENLLEAMTSFGI